MLTEAKALVAEYWKVLEHHGGLIVSKALLPKLKKDIKTALLTVSPGERIVAGESFERTKALQTVYAALSDFVGAEDDKKLMIACLMLHLQIV